MAMGFLPIRDIENTFAFFCLARLLPRQRSITEAQ